MYLSTSLLNEYKRFIKIVLSFRGMSVLCSRCGSISLVILRSNGQWKQQFSTSHIQQSLKDDFEVLGLPMIASRKDVKAAYIEKAKLLHPDKQSRYFMIYDNFHD